MNNSGRHSFYSREGISSSVIPEVSGPFNIKTFPMKITSIKFNLN